MNSGDINGAAAAARISEIHISKCRAETERLIAMASRELKFRRFESAKRLADQAIESDPLVDGADEIIAVADVITASQTLVNDCPDSYAVLQLGAGAGDAADVSRSYRRLALLLNPSRNRNPSAGDAVRIVSDSFEVLSNPNKKAFSILKRCKAADQKLSSFWTACYSCFHIFLYDRQYINLSIRCTICRRSFRALEILKPPIVVPGTDKYYCSWGFFPLGYPGGMRFEGFGGNAGFSEKCDEYCAMSTDKNLGNDKKLGTKVVKRTKTMVRENVGGGLRKPYLRRKGSEFDDDAVGNELPVQVSGFQPLSAEDEVVEVGGIDVNITVGEMNVDGEFSGYVGGGIVGNDGSLSFHIELDATDEILSNLHNFPFSKDDEIRLQMMP